jgi:tetratricopeptide (TPR) repeat protein
LDDQAKSMRQTIALCVAFLWMLASVDARAQPMDWASLIADGNRAMAEGRYAQAEAAFLTVLDQMKNLSESDVRLPTTLSLLGNIYVLTTRYEKAESLYLRALAICDRTSAKDGPAAAEIMDGLGTLYRVLGRYTEAEQWMKRAVLINERNFGLQHPYLGAFYHSLAIVLLAEGKFGDATKYIKRALALWKPDDPSRQEDIALATGTLGNINFSRGRYREGEECYQRALAALEKIRGPSHPKLISTLPSLALLYVAMKRYPEAETISRRAIAIAHANPEQPLANSAIAEIALGRALAGQGRFADAEPHFQSGLATLERVLGPRNILYAVRLMDYADSLRQAKLSHEASEIERRVTAILALSGRTVSVSELRHPRP